MVELNSVRDDTVDDHQRRAAVDRGEAADVERGQVVRVARHGVDVEVGNSSFQSRTNIVSGTVGELLGVGSGHGTREVGFLLRAITHDDNLIDGRHVVVEHDVHRL